MHIRVTGSYGGERSGTFVAGAYLSTQSWSSPPSCASFAESSSSGLGSFALPLPLSNFLLFVAGLAGLEEPVY